MHLPFQVGISPTLKIRGIIATETIKPGQILEKCPVILYNNKEHSLLQHTFVEKYQFDWNQKKDCFVLGYGSLYNHSYDPNATFSYDYKNQFIVFKAIKQISPGEEIIINYNRDPKNQEPIDPIYFT